MYWKKKKYGPLTSEGHFSSPKSHHAVQPAGKHWVAEAQLPAQKNTPAHGPRIRCKICIPLLFRKTPEAVMKPVFPDIFSFLQGVLDSLNGVH